MKTVENIPDLWKLRRAMSGTVGLVPTMGFLHEGHMTLVEESKKKCDHTVVSIFVNPTQFGPNEDLETYPRDLPRDLGMLKREGVDMVWLPTPEIMYPPGFQTWVDVEEVTLPLEGTKRSGHFRGVTTVVSKLFNGVLPDKVFFGQKDAQQIAVIKQMTHDLNFPVKIMTVPTAREKDGLAMSSRNMYLTEEQRKAAIVLYRALQNARYAYEEGQRDGDRLRRVMIDMINAEPYAKIDYVSCADRETLQELDIVTDGALLSMAVFIAKTRLIDNWILE